MKSLSKNDQKEQTEFVKTLRGKAGRVFDATQEVNEAIERLNDAIADYNATIEDANNWAQDLLSQMEQYKEGKTEKWQESNAGQQYDSWVQAWADDLESAEEIDLINVPEMDAIEVLEIRPVSPDQT